MFQLLSSLLLSTVLITMVPLTASDHTKDDDRGPWNGIANGLGWETEVNEIIFSKSKHDTRLKKFAMEYYDQWGVLSLQPLDCDIMKNLYWQKRVPCSLAIYHELLTETKKLLNMNRPIHAELINYLQEQYEKHRYLVHASCYTTVLVLTHASINMPIDICKKIVSFLPVETQVFKTDLLVMLRMYACGKLKNLPVHLLDYYKGIHTIYNH